MDRSAGEKASVGSDGGEVCSKDSVLSSSEVGLSLDQQKKILESVFVSASKCLSTYTGKELQTIVPPDRKLYLFLGVYTDDELSRLPDIFDEFIRTYDEKLTLLYDRYEDDNRSEPLIYDPTALLLIERLEKIPFTLKNEWDALLPESSLAKFALFWGISIDFE